MKHLTVRYRTIDLWQAPSETAVDAMIFAIDDKAKLSYCKLPHVSERLYWFTYYNY